MLSLVLLSFVISLVISATSIPVIIRVAHLKNLTDDPDQGRKLHVSNTPTLGGIAIFAGLLITFSGLYDLQGFRIFALSPRLLCCCFLRA